MKAILQLQELVNTSVMVVTILHLVVFLMLQNFQVFHPFPISLEAIFHLPLRVFTSLVVHLQSILVVHLQSILILILTLILILILIPILTQILIQTVLVTVVL